MNNSEYFKYALSKSKNGEFLGDREWYYTFFVLMRGSLLKGNKYIEVKDNKVFAKVNDRLELITTLNKDKTILGIGDELKLTNKDIRNIPEGKTVETTIMMAILNFCILVTPFKEYFIPFQNEEFDIGTIENNYILKMLTGKDKNVFLKLYRDNYFKACLFVASLSEIFVWSATEKTMLPPKGIKEYRATVVKDFDKKYGEDWKGDLTKISEFIAKLKEFDNAYLEGDPTHHVLLSGKILNVARVKMYLTIGTDDGFVKNGSETNLIVQSLLEGIPEDPESFVRIINNAREGSFKRGDETKFGGAKNKIFLRAISGIVIVKGDCGTKLTKTIEVNEDNYSSFVGRHYEKSGKIVKVEDIDESKDLIGKEENFRSPQYCSKEGAKFCSVCIGDMLSVKPEGLAVLVTTISAILMDTRMKATNAKELKLVEFDIFKEMG